MAAADEFYRIDGSKVWLSPTALEYAREFFGPGRQGARQMAKHLLTQQTPEQIEAADTPPPTAQEEFLPDATLSENIEDRRDEPLYGAGALRDIWRNTADAPPVVRTFGPNPLANALGFGDVGRVPAPAPQVLGPYQPRPFIPEGY